MNLTEQKGELQNCGIEYLGETASGQASGKLGKFLFSWGGRGYWIATGPMPLRSAWRLHAGRPGGNVIRVQGHCMCPCPEDPWVTYYTQGGKPVWTLKDREEALNAIRLNSTMRDWAEKFLRESHFDDERTEPKYKAYVEMYHIDSELGLYVYAEQVRILTFEPTMGSNTSLRQLNERLKKVKKAWEESETPEQAEPGKGDV